MTLFCFNGFAQEAWIEREPMAIDRIGATGFAIGNKGFVGMGRDVSLVYLKDFWEYYPDHDVWTQKSNYPGAGSYANSSAVIGNFAYVGLGYNGTASQTDWWRYDPATDTWTSKASYPGLPRYGASTFVIGSKIYVIAGSPGGVPYYQDAYVYDTVTDSWAAIAPFAGGLRNHTNACSFNGKGYAGMGTSDLTTCNIDLWEYDPVTDAWTQKTSMPGIGRTHGSHFLIGSKFYICAGLYIPTMTYLTDLWEYDILTDSWAARLTFPGYPRHFSVGFSVDGFGYLTTGGTSTAVYNDIWQYTPFTIGISDNPSRELNISFQTDPVAGSVTILSNKALTVASINIYNLQGQLVLTRNGICGNEAVISYNNITKGIYLLQVTDEGRVIAREKVLFL